MVRAAVEGREEPERKAADERRDEREHQHTRIDGDGLEPRNRQLLRDDAPQTERRPPCEQQTCGTARGREQQALGEELADESSAPGAERRAHRELAMTRRRAREQQIRHVRARDEQHESHRDEQDEQRRPHVAGQLIGQAHDPGAPAGVEGRKHPRQLRVNPRHVLLRLGDRDTRSHPCDGHEPAAAWRTGIGLEPDRLPDIDLPVENREPGRHHADHDLRPAVELNRLIDDRRVRTEAPPPEPVADHHDVRGRVVVSRLEQSPLLRRNAQDGRQRRGDVLHRKFFRRAAAARERGLERQADRRNVLERMVHLAPVQEVAGRDDVVLAVARQVVLPHDDELDGSL